MYHFVFFVFDFVFCFFAVYAYIINDGGDKGGVVRTGGLADC
jgi:hypothetical protein